VAGRVVVTRVSVQFGGYLSVEEECMLVRLNSCVVSEALEFVFQKEG